MGFAAPNQVTDATRANPGDTIRLDQPFARYRCRATITGPLNRKSDLFAVGELMSDHLPPII